MSIIYKVCPIPGWRNPATLPDLWLLFSFLALTFSSADASVLSRHSGPDPSRSLGGTDQPVFSVVSLCRSLIKAGTSENMRYPLPGKLQQKRCRFPILVPEIGSSTCFSAPSAPIYNRKRPVWQMEPPSPGVILTHLGRSCFCFVTFRLHNLCPFCAFGQKSGLHNPFYACIVQKTVKRLHFFLKFPIFRFAGGYFPWTVPSSPRGSLVPRNEFPGLSRASVKETPEGFRPPAPELLYGLFHPDGIGHFSTSQMAWGSFFSMSARTCSVVSRFQVTFCRISRWSSALAAIPNTRYTVSFPQEIPWG